MKKAPQIISLLLVAASMLLIILYNFDGNVTKGGESLIQTNPSDLSEEPTGEVPQDLLVVPEVPLGTIATIMACFFALMVSQRKHVAKLQ